MTRSIILRRPIANLVEDFLKKFARATDTPMSEVLVYDSFNSGQGETLDPLIRCLTGSLAYQRALDSSGEVAYKLGQALTRFNFVPHPSGTSLPDTYWMHMGDDRWVSTNLEGRGLTELFSAYPQISRSDRLVIPSTWRTASGTFEVSE